MPSILGPAVTEERTEATKTQAGGPHSAALDVEPADLRRLLRQRPFGLFTDFDGTISRIAPTPDAAVISPGARQALVRLAPRLAVVVISGRTLPDLRARVGLSGVIYVGSHGIATLIDGVEEWDPGVRPYRRYAPALASELRALRTIEGVLLEDKLIGLAVHYRLTRDPESVRERILSAIAAAPTAAHFDLIEGVKVVELRPRAGINKGTAVETLAFRLRLKGLLYLGDDLTDVQAFDALARIRSRGEAGALSVAVRNGEASPAVEAAADLTVDGVAGAESVLETVERLTRGG